MSDLAEEIVAKLEERGYPQGEWLLEITAARRALKAGFLLADDLLGRLQETALQGYEEERLRGLLDGLGERDDDDGAAA